MLRFSGNDSDYGFGLGLARKSNGSVAQWGTSLGNPPTDLTDVAAVAVQRRDERVAQTRAAEQTRTAPEEELIARFMDAEASRGDLRAAGEFGDTTAQILEAMGRDHPRFFRLLLV